MQPNKRTNKQSDWRERKAERRREAALAGHRARIESEGPEYWRADFERGRPLGTAASVASRQAASEQRRAVYLGLNPAQRDQLKRLSQETGVSAAALVRACLARSLPAVVGAHRRALADKQALKRFSERVIRDSAREWEVE